MVREAKKIPVETPATAVPGGDPNVVPDGRVKPRLPTIRYWIDAHDRVIRVNDAWARFAAENDGGPVEAASGILGRTLWSFIEDATIGSLYRDMVLLARKGRSVGFGFRCDAPGFRRIFQMRISGGKADEVEFASTLESEEAREPVSLLDCHQPRNEQYLRMCSWCQRVHAKGQWVPVEAAVVLLNVMSGPAVPSITHGICGDCHGRIMAEISKLRLAS